MTNVIAFLEAMGQDASLHGTGRSDLAAALDAAAIGPEPKALILAGETKALSTLLGAEPIICCFLAPEKKEEDDKEEQPAKEDEVTGMAANVVALVD